MLRKLDYDVAIIGGGIGGSMLAAILARHGVRVVQIEAGSHPRFAIGESTVPETSFGLRVLARRYDVPEIENLATHGALRRNVSPACGVKRNLSFVYHREGELMRADECNQIPTFGPPLGPDSHYFRQDVDAYLTYVACSYGAKLLTQAPVESVHFATDRVTLTIRGGEQIHASYVVDAGGQRALLPEQLGLRQEPPFRTRSRTIFTHMTDVRPFDEVAPPRSEHKLPSPFSQGTLHHFFPGGWMWIIPFDNHFQSTNQLCSVGLTLNLDRYPSPSPDETPEQEFWRHVQRFPSIARQLRYARSARPFIGSARNQFTSTQIIGERFCLLPHASDFIDPLFSSGLAVTVSALNALGHRLIDAVREQDFSTERFEYVATWTKRMFRYYDDLISSGYTSFDSFELWNAWMRVWLIGTLYGTNAQHQAAVRYENTGDPEAFMKLEQTPYRGLQGVDFAPYEHVFQQGVRWMRQYADGECSADTAIAQLYSLLRKSELCPDTWNVLDPYDRSPSGAFTMVPLARALRWGMRRSPPHVRGRYFSGGFKFVLKEAVEQYSRELVRSATSAEQFLRDMFINWNRDWTRRPPPRHLRADPPITPSSPASVERSSTDRVPRAAE